MTLVCSWDSKLKPKEITIIRVGGALLRKSTPRVEITLGSPLEERCSFLPLSWVQSRGECGGHTFSPSTWDYSL